MNDLPPPIQNSPYPRFDLSAPEEHGPRNYLGWVVLALFFTLMISMELVQYLDRGTKPQSKYSKVAQELKVAVEMREMTKNISPMASSGSDQTLNGVIEDVEADAPNDPAAARIYAAAKSEQGAEVPENVLARLRSSKDKRDHALAEVFGSKTLTLKRAQEIDKQLEGKAIVDKIAEAQAYEKAGDRSRREQMMPQSKAYGRIAVFAVALGAGAFGFVLLVIYGVMKLMGHLPAKGFPLRAISYADADKLALRCAQLFAAFLGVSLVVPTLGSAVGMGAINPHLTTLLTYIALIAVFLFLFKFPIGRRRFSLGSIGINRENLGSNIAWGIGCAMANLPIVLVTALLGQYLFSGLPQPEHPATVQIQGGVSWFGTLVIFFAASIGAPILEEIMFRGTLLPALAKVWGRPVLAILLQGLIFAAIHPTGIPAWLPLATIGAMSGFLSRQTGSLVPSMVMHAVHNFGTLILATTLLS